MFLEHSTYQNLLPAEKLLKQLETIIIPSSSNTEITNTTSLNSEKHYYRSPKYLTKKLLYPKYLDNIIEDLPDNATLLIIGEIKNTSQSKSVNVLRLPNECDRSPLLQTLGE